MTPDYLQTARECGASISELGWTGVVCSIAFTPDQLAAFVERVSAPAWIELTDDDRDRAFQTLPDMLDGFLKKWGWLHFAKAIEAICRKKNAPPAPAAIQEKNP